MESLPRTLQKIFGLTGDTDQFGKVGSDSAGSPAVTKNLDEIQSLSQFEAGLFSITANLANPPRGEDFNALLYLITSQLKYLFQSGVPEWLATENYYANKSIVIGSDGNLYKSKTGSDVSPNINHNPVGDTTNWAIFWDIANDGSGSGLDADIVRGTTPGTRGLQYLAAAAVSNIAALILSDLKTVDGSGSGLDADLLDGQHGSYYAAASAIGNLDFVNGAAGTYGNVLIAGLSTWIIPKGTYVITADNNHMLAISNDSDNWFTGIGGCSGLIVSDGVHYRIYNSNSGDSRLYYRKLA